MGGEHVSWFGDAWKLIQQTRGKCRSSGIPRPRITLEEEPQSRERWKSSTSEGTYSTYLVFQPVTVNYGYADPTVPVRGPGYRFPGADIGTFPFHKEMIQEHLVQAQAANEIIKIYNGGVRKDPPRQALALFHVDR
jgi:hypothetical protein